MPSIDDIAAEYVERAAALDRATPLTPGSRGTTTSWRILRAHSSWDERQLRGLVHRIADLARVGSGSTWASATRSGGRICGAAAER